MAATKQTPKSSSLGMTLIELVVCTLIIGILASTAAPLAKNGIRREKERALRTHLNDMRRAIDRFYEKAAKEAPNQPDFSYYPKTLDDLVNKRIIRSIPIDPFTQKADWQTRSSTDEPNAQVSNNQNVFDVFSATDKTDSNGIKYSSW